MDGAWEGPHWPEGTSRRPGFQELMERTEAMHRGAAARLRRMGWEESARRAEGFAAWARFALDEPQVARQLYATALWSRQPSGRELLYDKVLEGALSLAGADRGSLQLVGPATGAAAPALHRAARAHAGAAEAHERSARAGVGDMAEHQRLAEFHRVAAEADRQRAEEAESQAAAPSWTDARRFEAVMLESQALRQISEEARARARATREQIYQGRSRRAVLHDSAYARLQARMETMPVIEQAKGIVMVQQECGPEEAFDLLRRISQRTGVKVHALAAQIVEHVAAGGHRGNVTPISLGALRYLPSGTRAEPAAAEADNPTSRVNR